MEAPAAGVAVVEVAERLAAQTAALRQRADEVSALLRRCEDRSRHQEEREGMLRGMEDRLRQWEADLAQREGALAESEEQLQLERAAAARLEERERAVAEAEELFRQRQEAAAAAAAASEAALAERGRAAAEAEELLRRRQRAADAQTRSPQLRLHTPHRERPGGPRLAAFARGASPAWVARGAAARTASTVSSLRSPSRTPASAVRSLSCASKESDTGAILRSGSWASPARRDAWRPPSACGDRPPRADSVRRASATPQTPARSGSGLPLAPRTDPRQAPPQRPAEAGGSRRLRSVTMSSCSSRGHSPPPTHPRPGRNPGDGGGRSAQRQRSSDTQPGGHRAGERAPLRHRSCEAPAPWALQGPHRAAGSRQFRPAPAPGGRGTPQRGHAAAHRPRNPLAAPVAP
eukprot:TRINITY_DN24758_c0_g1_i4.p3 TRINITY_DN24758_c0_g1~~TRINITY_DN24758_c0_g1_i4.p3  ORF type:complete len:406 (+),score=71.58 TRINITY_DN24758_c0_g1_i4:110-1327(+)